MVGDGPQETWVENLVEGLGFRYLVHGPTRDWGNQQRNFAYKTLHADYVVHMDDDDVFTEDAFVKVRKGIVQDPGVPLMFRMRSVPGEVVWTERVLERGNTSTIMFVVPNDRARLLRNPWGNRQGSDVRFMQACEKEWGEISWKQDLIGISRPT